MASNQMTAAALGRPFELGMLYDARTDELLKGSVLWDSGKLQSMTLRKPQPYSNFKITASDSIEEKSSLLEIQASLRASVLWGLVKGEGSAQYLHDKRRFKNQSRVTLQYKATTHFEQLSLTEDDRENIQNREVMESGLATHVVTGIEYGANAFFLFDSGLLEASEVQETRIKIQVVVNLLLWSVHFDYNRDLTEEQKSLAKTLTVKFYSDFLVESEPATFTEAVQTYSDMTKLLGKNDQNAVPVKVWMTPLGVSDGLVQGVSDGLVQGVSVGLVQGVSDGLVQGVSVGLVQGVSDGLVQGVSDGLVQGVSDGLVFEAESILEELSDIQMRCNDCLSADAVGKFPPLRHQLHKFQKLCHYYTAELQRQMAEKCPAIREGKLDESALRSVFDEREKSPFSQDRLTQWLDDKEREINVIQACVDLMVQVPVLSTQAEVDRFVLAPEHAVCSGFIFTSLETTDAQLQDMSRGLNALKLGERYERLEQASDQPWFYSDQIVIKMRKTAEEFNATKASATVFVAAEYRDEQSGAVVVKYRGGILESQSHTETDPGFLRLQGQMRPAVQL